MSKTFSSLSVPNYRTYALGAVVSNTGTWMGRVAQSWLVLTELTNNSAMALGWLSALQFGPALFMAPVAGAISDRFPKRVVMMWTQALMALNLLIAGVLVVTGAAELWMILALSLLMGITTAVDAPARQAFTSELVPKNMLANAVSLNSASFNLARLLGPAVAGLLIAWIGTGWTLVLNAATFGAVITSLVVLDQSALATSPISKGKGKIREGLAYVKGRPDLILIMTLVFVLGTFGMNFQMTMALMATEVYDKGATEYGVLGSVMAIGSLSAALLAARRSNPRLRHLLSSLAGFTASMALLGAAPTYVTFGILLVPTGLFALMAMITANSMVQLSTDPAVRGRVMALYMAIFMGGTPLGSPMLGWVATHWGARWTLLAPALLIGVVVVVATVRIMHKDDLHIRYERQARRRFVLERGALQETPQRPT